MNFASTRYHFCITWLLCITNVIFFPFYIATGLLLLIGSLLLAAHYFSVFVSDVPPGDFNATHDSFHSLSISWHLPPSCIEVEVILWLQINEEKFKLDMDNVQASSYTYNGENEAVMLKSIYE